MNYEDELYALELHETKTIGGQAVTRVMNGYIYHCGFTDVYVPDKINEKGYCHGRD